MDLKRKKHSEEQNLDHPEAKHALRRATGRNYLDFLADMHRVLQPDWYLEVGTQTGKSLALSSARSVAVDPEFTLKHDVIKGKPELYLFQDTSDAFFADSHLRRIGAQFDLAFLDGMHLYEFLLRDFINAEKFMRPSGRIVLHDCMPWEPSMAERDRRKAQSRAWTGDVWKLLPILAEYRPDLVVTAYDAAPTGLVVVENLDPGNRVLSERYDEIIEKYDQANNVVEIVSAFDISSADASPWSPTATGSEDRLNFVVQLPVPRPRVQQGWGDYHFGMGLVEALKRKGHEARVQTKKSWGEVRNPGEIDIVLRGRAEYEKRPGHNAIYWIISGDAQIPESELADADHIFVAGKPLMQQLSKNLGAERLSLLPQAFDSKRMFVPDADEKREGIVFVGVARKDMRAMVSHALASGTEISIWGNGWTESDAAAYYQGSNMPNEELGHLYSSVEIVLNDHRAVMSNAGLLSNRVFDALACGTPVISDPVAWVPEDLSEFIEIVTTPDEFVTAIAKIRAETPEKRKARSELAERMLTDHSFDARAEVIIEKARELTQPVRAKK